MRFSLKNISILILAAAFFAFGSGVTVCKMVCLSSGDIEYALNEEGSCCEEDNDACCENESDPAENCCTHTDNSLQLDQYIPGEKFIVSTIEQPVDVFVLVSIIEDPNTRLSVTNYSPPPPLRSEDISTFTHILRI